MRSLLGEERDRQNKADQKKKDKEILKDIKNANKDRVQHGQEPVFYKKSKRLIINRFLTGIYRRAKRP